MNEPTPTPPATATTTPGSATAIAPSNIAFLKYWGNVDAGRRLPYNDSLSMTLDAATTTTTVTFSDSAQADRLTIDGAPHEGAALERVGRQLDRVRARAGIAAAAHVASRNTFPMGTGIASSASAFAALTVAACAAAGLALDERSLSALARRGSGSAARSVPGGFVAWHSGATDEASYAETIHPPEHWDLRDVVAVVSAEHKQVGSGGGHALATSSALFPARLRTLRQRIVAMREAIAARDLSALGPQLEAEALELHAVAMTSHPPVLYWTGATVELLRQAPAWRAAGLPVYFTLDAGPNVHLICEGAHAEALVEELTRLPYVQQVLHNRPAAGARLA